MMELTLQLKLLNGKQLDTSIIQYTKALNFISQKMFELEDSNTHRLQKLFYREVKNNFGITAQMTCNAFRDVSGKYKTYKKKLKKENSRRKSQNKKFEKWNNKHPNKTPKKLKEPLELKVLNFKDTHCYFSFQRDFLLKDKRLKITGINGRKEYKYLTGKYQLEILNNCEKILGSQIRKNKKGEYYFDLTVEVKEPEKIKSNNICGIDRGLNKPIVAYAHGKYKTFGNGSIKNKKYIYAKTRQRLQAKGTKSAKKVLRHLSGKETRWMRDCNFCLVKNLLNWLETQNISTIGIEDLSGVRRKKYPKKPKKKTLKTNFNREINQWSYYQQEFILDYKARQRGMEIVKVKPYFTSQACSKCGFVNKKNRTTQGNFTCLKCGHHLNADNNATNNISLLTYLHRAGLDVNWDACFACQKRAKRVNHPYEAYDELEGFYKQLRGSIVSSPFVRLVEQSAGVKPATSVRWG